jgi:hypothetical protein
LKVLPTDDLRSPKEVSKFLHDEIRELQDSGEKVLKFKVSVQVQGAPIPSPWRKALEAFSNGTTLGEFYVHIEGELGASRTGKQKKISEKSLRRRKHSQFLSTLKRLSDRGILAVSPSSFLDERDSLAGSGTRAGWAEEISTVWVKPNLMKLKRETGSQATWVEERTVTLRKKGEGVGNIVIEGLTTKPMRLAPQRQS